MNPILYTGVFSSASVLRYVIFAMVGNVMVPSSVHEAATALIGCSRSDYILHSSLSLSLSLILSCVVPKAERNEKISYNFPNNLIKNLVPAAVLLKTILINTTSPSKPVSAKLFRE